LIFFNIKKFIQSVFITEAVQNVNTEFYSFMLRCQVRSIDQEIDLGLLFPLEAVSFFVEHHIRHFLKLSDESPAQKTLPKKETQPA